MNSSNKYLQSGFSLVEMIVSLAVFSIVATVSVGALLVLISSNIQLQNEQSVMTNLSFALDSMAREIRTGTDYFCSSQNVVTAGPPDDRIFQDGAVLDPDVRNDCPDGNDNNNPRPYHGISFLEGGQSITNAVDTRIVYYFDANQGKIMRRISAQDAKPITSSGIYIINAEFYVTGSEPLSTPPGDTEQDQSSVTVYIEAKEKDDPTAKTYKIQTTIVQRALDI